MAQVAEASRLKAESSSQLGTFDAQSCKQLEEKGASREHMTASVTLTVILLQRAHDDEQVPENEPPIRRRCARLAARADVPVHRLPPEILAEIFLHFCQLVLQSPYFPDPIPTLDTTITCVCKRWRQIAYGTPQLWRYIASPTRRIKAYLKRYVPLAKGCLLFAQGPNISTAFLTLSSLLAS